MKKPELFSIQILTILISTIFGAGIMSFQAGMISVAKQDAWISTLIGGILTIGFGLIAYALARLYPSKDLPEICIDIFGRVLGRVVVFIMLVQSLLLSSLIIRIFAEFVKVYLLEKTPIFVLMFLIAFSVALTVKRGIYVLGVVMDFCFPVFMLAMVMLIVLSLSQADITYIEQKYKKCF